MILIDNLHAEGHYNWGTLSTTAPEGHYNWGTLSSIASIFQQFNQILFYFHSITSESRYAQHVEHVLLSQAAVISHFTN